MMVSSEVRSWLIVCCSVWEMLSMSLVTRLSSSPRGWPVEVAQRQPRQLRLRPVSRSRIHGPLHDAGRAAGPARARAASAARRSPARSAAPGRPGRNRCRGRGRCHRVDHVGEAAVALCRSSATASALVTPGRELACRSTPAKIRSVALPRIFGPSTVSPTLDAAQKATAAVRTQPPRPSSAFDAVAGGGPLQPADLGREARPQPSCGSLGRLRPCRRSPSQRAARGSLLRRFGPPASCSVSWESTISR